MDDHESLMKYLKPILALVLIISVGLSLYDHFVWIPQIEAEGQATENNLRVQAFNVWLSKMTLIRNLLGQVQTYLDLEEVSVHTSWALAFERVIESGIDIFHYKEKLYYWVYETAFYLDRAVSEGYLNRNVDQNMISNVTLNMGPLTNLNSLSLNGVDPAQQLRGAGVLEDVMNHLEQIYQVTLNFLVVNHY